MFAFSSIAGDVALPTIALTSKVSLIFWISSFDEEWTLQTDLYKKETDSTSYLNFSSSHPNHTFSGNVYSQSLRLRRILNSDERLRTRLRELAEAFKEAGYPEKMVTEITDKVKNSSRNIEVQTK